MAVAGWILDKSASVHAFDPTVESGLADVPGELFICPTGRLEQLHSAHSARQYEQMAAGFSESFSAADAPVDILERALRLQRDLAHHQELWHRIPIPDLLIAETALHHGLGVVTLDKDFDRIAKVRGLTVRRLGD